MTSYHKHKILSGINLVIQYFNGTLDLNAAINGKSEVLKDPAYKSELNSIVDFRDAVLEFTDEEITTFINFLRKEHDTDAHRKTVLLTNTPNQVVFLTIFSNESENLGVRYQIVSTLTAAVEWLGLDKKYEEIINILIEHFKKI